MTAADLTPDGHGAAHTFIVDASDLRWPPGHFPETTELNGMGNGQPLVRQGVFKHFVTYVQAFGCIKVRVFND